MLARPSSTSTTGVRQHSPPTRAASAERTKTPLRSLPAALFFIDSSLRGSALAAALEACPAQGELRRWRSLPGRASTAATVPHYEMQRSHPGYSPRYRKEAVLRRDCNRGRAAPDSGPVTEGPFGHLRDSGIQSNPR